VSRLAAGGTAGELSGMMTSAASASELRAASFISSYPEAALLITKYLNTSPWPMSPKAQQPTASRKECSIE